MDSCECLNLPPLIELSDFNGNWTRYENQLYEIFLTDFVDSSPHLFGKPVRYRKNPMILDKIQAFFHITSENTSKLDDPNDRIPDFRRCERIHWVRKFLENCGCHNGCIKFWPEKRGPYKRWHLLLEEVKFMVVVEEREDYNLLITSFYIERDHQLRKKLKKYNEYKEQETLL